MRDLSEREVRALTEYLTVIPHAPDVYVVVSGSGKSHTVDARDGACTCRDAQYRDRTCKHQFRAEFETGARTIPAWVDRDRIPRDFSAHVDADPDFEDAADATDDSDMVIA